MLYPIARPEPIHINLEQAIVCVSVFCWDHGAREGLIILRIFPHLSMQSKRADHSRIAHGLIVLLKGLEAG